MIIETMENGLYKSFDVDNNEILLTIEALGNNVYKAKNKTFCITAEIVPLNEYQNQVKCIEHKRADKLGRYRKTTKLLQHNLSWLDWIVEEKGFIRKKKVKEI